jgi:hypothetical protein
MSSNQLRMPFAEWLFRMSEAGLAPQARELAVYAVAFKVSSNEELAKLAGMDTIVSGKSIADKTYNRWKKLLTDDGWVILKAVTVGRVTTIEVFPACGSEPVTFTDMKARDASKFYGRELDRNSYETAVEDTDEIGVSPVEVTAEARNGYGETVEVTGGSRALTCARIDNFTSLTTLKEKEESEVSEEKEEGGADAPSARDAQTAFELWNDLALRIGLSQARTLTPQRRKSLIARLREHGGLDAWRTALSHVERSAFLQVTNDRGWRADLDFLLQASRFTKVVEGGYGNGAHAQPKESSLSKIDRMVDQAFSNLPNSNRSLT